MSDQATCTEILRSDIVIVGGGIAGASAAGMLGNAGIDTILVDPNLEFPHEFRCEKLDPEQMALLEKVGFLDPVIQATTRIDFVEIARLGHKVRRKEERHIGFTYETMVNAVREQIPSSVKHVASKVIGIEASPNLQRITLLSGQVVEARLVVLASGLNIQLREMLGIRHETISRNHILAAAFEIEPANDNKFQFNSATFGSENVNSRAALITLFPSRGVMRANLFGYWNAKDDIVRLLREDPDAALARVMPNLQRLTGAFKVKKERITLRAVELYQSHPDRLDGVVLVGDAYSTSCPGAGTGVTKALTDIVQLCNSHIPNWLETDGMDAAKLRSFYDDPVKLEADKASRDSALFLKELSTNKSPRWIFQRWARMGWHMLQGIKANGFSNFKQQEQVPAQTQIQPGE